MSNRASKKPRNEILRSSSYEVGTAEKRRLQQGEKWGQVGGAWRPKKGLNNWKKEKRKQKKKGGKKLKPLSFGIKQNKMEKKKNKVGSTLIRARRKPTRAVCSRWSYPIQAELSLVLGGVPVLPTVPPVAQVRRGDGELGCSLVCIGGVLSLAVVPTALQKLHKCVTQNTTELLQERGGRETRTTSNTPARLHLTKLPQIMT